MPDLDALLREGLQRDAASVVVPPVGDVLGRARRRQRVRLAVAGVAVLGVVGAGAALVPRGSGDDPARLAGPAVARVLADGTDDRGPWTVRWRPDERCLELVRTGSTGGACALADPPAFGAEAVRFQADGRVLVAGLAPAETATVRVTTPSGTVDADVTRADAVLFVAALPPGEPATDVGLDAYTSDGRLLATHSASYPPLGAPEGVPPAPEVSYAVTDEAGTAVGPDEVRPVPARLRVLALTAEPRRVCTVSFHLLGPGGDDLGVDLGGPAVLGEPADVGWDGRAADGSSVPAGTYRLVARSAAADDCATGDRAAQDTSLVLFGVE